MTDDNQKENAKTEMAVAERCLTEARTLLAAGLHYVGLFGEHFVKSGMLPTRLGRLVSRMQRDREDADYVVGAIFTDAEATIAVNDAQWALAEMQKLLSSS